MNFLFFLTVANGLATNSKYMAVGRVSLKPPLVVGRVSPKPPCLGAAMARRDKGKCRRGLKTGFCVMNTSAAAYAAAGDGGLGETRPTAVARSAPQLGEVNAAS
ncbi:MAG: hypothetical protein GX230_05715 [Lentisphaerae bacterium]|nr:hypothetical protein [Lentisphaerota bacterium]